ncbi:MAG: NADH-quinone oxidoreductase subunit 11 [Oligoflexia bacterium]|nr:MAG: NADH-quinone oxidoreductase subunit 11 [Oligoflexia bacterium]
MLISWVLVSLLLFSLGIYGVLTRRSAVGLLISVELMLNAAALNLVVFNRFLFASRMDGQILTIFVIALAAAEVLIGMAILVMLFRRKKSVDVTQLSQLKH